MNCNRLGTTTAYCEPVNLVIAQACYILTKCFRALVASFVYILLVSIQYATKIDSSCRLLASTVLRSGVVGGTLHVASVLLCVHVSVCFLINSRPV